MRPATLAFAILCLLTSQASATTFDAYYGFGDSTLDSGWWAGALNGQCGQVTPSCTTGNSMKDAKIAAAILNGGTGAPVGVGKMSSQDLAGDFGLTAIPANQTNGTNYAISGALSARASGYPPNLNPAVQYGNLNPNPNLPSTVEQIQTYLTTHSNTADPNAIYEISSGGNDRTYANENPSFTTFTQRANFLAAQASALATAIQSLAADGAKTILVRGAQSNAPGSLASIWTHDLFADLSTLHVNFIQVDMADLVQTVENNPTHYGFTAATVQPGVAGQGNSTSSACAAGLTATGWGQWCANTTTPDPNHLYSRLTSADSETISFYSDDQHFSDAGQKIVADYEYELLNPAPLPSTLPLFISGVAALGLIGWRRKTKNAALAA